MTDDAGLCVDALNGEPGVYSARYAGDHASQMECITKVLNKMENVFDMIDTIYDFRISKGLQDEPCIIVWDSVAGTATQEMVERKADQKEIGSEAKVLARAINCLNSPAIIITYSSLGACLPSTPFLVSPLTESIIA